MPKAAAVRIDTARIPDYVGYETTRVLIRAMENFFARPGVQEKYEAWLAARKEAQRNAEIENAGAPDDGKAQGV